MPCGRSGRRCACACASSCRPRRRVSPRATGSRPSAPPRDCCVSGAGSPKRSQRRRRRSSCRDCVGTMRSSRASSEGQGATWRSGGSRRCRGASGTRSRGQAARARQHRARGPDRRWSCATVVTGMPKCTARSPGVVVARGPRSGRRRWVEAVTSARAGAHLRMPQSAAALRWLKTALSPHARTAAIQVECRGPRSMADGIDAAVDRHEATRSDPMVDRSSPEPQIA